MKTSTTLILSTDNLSIKRVIVYTPELSKDAEDRTIYVENLGRNMDIDQLHQVFAKFGEVKMAHPFRKGKKDKDSKTELKELTGEAFVEFATIEQAKSALDGLQKKEAAKIYESSIQSGDFDLSLVRVLSKYDFFNSSY